jgi:predicted porin
MKKRLIAVAALALVSGMAAAQSSVTIYGNVDVGLLTQNRSADTLANTTDDGRATTLANGGISPSIWGFRGVEDLGNGLKAVFNLEGHFSADTGVSHPSLFRRQSNVGLSSANFGTVLLGNQYSPAILAFAATDPRGLRENFSGLYSWAYNSGVVAKNSAGALGVNGNNGNNDNSGVFVQNAISYSNTFGLVGVGVAYSVSELKGAVYSLGVTYTSPLVLSAAYQSTNKPNTSDRLSALYTVGAGYTMDAFTGKLNYLRGDNKDSTTMVETSKVDVVGLGLDWKTATNNTASVALYHGKDKNNNADKTTTFILSDEYSLSKRTTLYGQLVYADANSGATAMTTMVAGGTMANANTTLLNVGIRHSF